ncbi:DUF7507 domain-containing protein [Nakamurella sp.]|uniref:DUF7507 domain-containing protein n=1 Tax=Nakamurella sp. TaxID=1869182 RepID=UPI003B3A57EA
MAGRVRRLGRLIVGAVALAAALPVVAAPSAAAAPGPVYASFADLTGTAGAYQGAMTLAPGFPTATITSTSRSGGVGPQTGTSTWLPAGSPPGAEFGSSQGQAYLNLRPASDDAAGASVTTYTFATPTPGSGWGFVLGDIDADQVTVTATDPDGHPVPATDLGFAGVFNYCDATPRSSTCSGLAAPYDVPTWDPATATLTGNADATDTVGAAGWFRPTAPLETLTLTFRGRSGFPVFQTWFATQTRAVSGTVTTGGAGAGGVTVEIVDAGGTVVATVTTAGDGTYQQDGLGPGEYTVRAATPDGSLPAGPTERPADLTTADASAVDFAFVAPADLAVTKSVDTSPVVAGAPVDYTVTVTNKGPAAATGVTVTDAVPGPLTGVSGQVTGGAACTPDGALLQCPIGSLAVGATVTVRVTGTVPADAAPGSVLLNRASVAGDQPDARPADNRAAAAVRVTASADLDLVKTVTPDEPVAGGPVEYRLTVTNKGPSTATGVTISDPLDPALTIGEVTTTAGTCSRSGGILTCVVPTLEPNATVTVSVPATLPPDADPALQNIASVTAATADPDPADNTGVAVVEPDRQADLALVKTASPATASPGQTVTYVLAVSNAGPSDAPGVLLTDPIPAGLTGLTVTDAGGADCTVDDRVSCVWASVPASSTGASTGESTRTVTLSAVVAPDAPDGPLTNTAAVAAPVDDPDPSNTAAGATVAITATADLSLSKTAGPDPVAPGATVSFRLVVGNAGPQPSALAEVRDPIPAGLTGVAVDDPDCRVDTEEVTCLLRDLGAGQERTVTVTGTVAAGFTGATLTNTATVTSLLTVDPDPAGNTASATVAVRPPPAGSNLVVTKTATTPTVDQGGVAGFVVTVTNAGATEQRDVVVAEQPDDGLVITSATPSAGTWDGESATWTIPSLAAGAGAVLTVSATAAGTGVLTNTAALTASGGPDPDPGDDTASASVQVVPVADLTLTKSVTPTAPAPGDPVTYTLTATNTGPATATGVRVVDTLPAGVAGPSESGSVACTISGQTVDCTLGDVPVGGTATITIGAVVLAGTTGTVVNTASISATTADPDPTNNTASASFTVTSSAVAPWTPPTWTPGPTPPPVSYPTGSGTGGLAATGAPITGQLAWAGLLRAGGVRLRRLGRPRPVGPDRLTRGPGPVSRARRPGRARRRPR